MRIEALRSSALELPEATEQPHFHYTSFRVRGKIFATVPPGEDTLHVFVGDEMRDQALALEPHCLEKLLWGGKVVGLRVALAKAPSALVRQLLREAWRHKAPKSLHAQLP